MMHKSVVEVSGDDPELEIEVVWEDHDEERASGTQRCLPRPALVFDLDDLAPAQEVEAWECCVVDDLDDFDDDAPTLDMPRVLQPALVGTSRRK
jgi:hypothetical protein